MNDFNLDILIRGGNGILRGDILTVCQNGIISFHHANNEINTTNVKTFHDFPWSEKAIIEAKAVVNNVGLSYSSFSKNYY